MTKDATTAPPSVVRCAVYTRKSSEEGLDQDFNSLDAQRESAEAYIASQRSEGWVCLPDRYDDGGFTGGNMDRPALARLLADIASSKIQVVVVYKVDRLSRSLLDFAKMMGTFDTYHVSFVSVTQQFNTATSMGRLVLNVLLSFAQFEREIISERTRDKIAATRRKGKWAGGHPLLGYDVDPRGCFLTVNKTEASRIRQIFALYLKHRGLIPVVEELERRGWVTKRWVSRKGRKRGGRLFTKNSLYRLLSNVTYAGRVKYKNEVHPGEHTGIVEPAIWREVQTLLQRNGHDCRVPVRSRVGALLQGLLRCVPCGCAMTPSFAAKNKTRRYRYYVCCAAQRRGWRTCPSKSLPAVEIERFVLEQIQALGNDHSLLRKAFSQESTSKSAKWSVDDVAKAWPAFDRRWATFTPEEASRLVGITVERVDYDGAKGKVAIAFRPAGIRQLVQEWILPTKEKNR
jgi:site-specific DNA recombinase